MAFLCRPVWVREPTSRSPVGERRAGPVIGHELRLAGSPDHTVAPGWGRAHHSPEESSLPSHDPAQPAPLTFTDLALDAVVVDALERLEITTPTPVQAA